MAQAQHSVSQTEGEQGAADAVMIGPGLRPAEDEFKAQILTLQVVSIDLAMSNAACDGSGDTQRNINKLQGLCAEEVTSGQTDSFKHLALN